MGMIRSLSLVLLSAVLVTMAHGCCNPDQYEAGIGLTSGSVQAGKTSLTQGVMNVSYDYTNKRRQATSALKIDNVYTLTKVILKDSKLYSIDLAKKTCVVTPNIPMDRSCVPDAAVYVGTVRLGMGSSSFLINSYQINVPWISGTGYLAVTNDNCMFQSGIAYGQTTESSIMATTGYFNSTLGISDPSVFDVPSYCPHSTLNAEDLVNGKHVVNNVPIQHHHFGLF